MLTWISIQTLIQINHVVQELYAFSLTANGRTDSQTYRQADSHSDYSAHLRNVQLYLALPSLFLNLCTYRKTILFLKLYFCSFYTYLVSLTGSYILSFANALSCQQKSRATIGQPAYNNGPLWYAYLSANERLVLQYPCSSNMPKVVSAAH